ncbi:MAG: hypothetical protein O2931_02500 [Planctomycetota bacterium]|nr:hypothetical protein [Planctomycetota bacterium]MDA1177645.1 hypothetical protein [Planctomycetota bacterium]
MARGLTIIGMVVAILLLVLFSLDLAIKVPFQRFSILMDVSFVVCAVLVGYMSWSTMKELD